MTAGFGLVAVGPPLALLGTFAATHAVTRAGLHPPRGCLLASYVVYALAAGAAGFDEPRVALGLAGAAYTLDLVQLGIDVHVGHRVHLGARDERLPGAETEN